MSLHSAREILTAKQDPLIPSVADLRVEVATPQPPLPKKFIELRDYLDAFAGKLATSPEPLPVLGFPGSLKYSDLVADRPVFLPRWPSGLYIPGNADYKQYWFLPPPDGENRYTRQWVLGNGSAANHAFAATGDLFAYAAARPIDPQLRSEAGIGFVFKPSATLAVYRIEVTTNLLGQHRYDVNTTAPAGGTLREWGGLYTAAWEINPVDNSLTLVRPFGLATLFDETFQNLTGIPIHDSPMTGTTWTNIMLERGRSYLIGVIAAVQIDNRWTMSNGAPMQPLPQGSTWKAWCAITGIIPQVRIRPTTIYIQ
jgi:hypothetical protein